MLTLFLCLNTVEKIHFYKSQIAYCIAIMERERKKPSAKSWEEIKTSDRLKAAAVQCRTWVYCTSTTVPWRSHKHGRIKGTSSYLQDFIALTAALPNVSVVRRFSAQTRRKSRQSASRRRRSLPGPTWRPRGGSLQPPTAARCVSTNTKPIDI